MKKIIFKIWQVLVVCLISIWSVVSDGLVSILDALETKKGYKAEFGDSSNISSRFNKGFFITRNGRLTSKLSYENMLISGVTGSGKTSTLLTKSIWGLKNCSMVINDPSGELYNLTSGHLSNSLKIRTLNFSASNKSSGFNPMSRIFRQTDAHKLAEMIVTSSNKGQSGGDPFWTIQSQALITIFIQILQYQKERYRNMANLVDLINRFASAPKTIDVLVIRTGDKKLLSEYKAFVSFPQKTLQNIVATVKSNLRIFTDEEVAKVTSTDTLDFANFRNEPTVLYIHNSVGDQRYYSILNAIFFEQLYSYLLSELPKPDDLDVFFVLEEASSLYIPLLPLALANLRKYRSGTIICTQSPTQLKTLYGNDFNNIVTNCQTKCYLAGQTDPEILRNLETLGGKYVSTDEKGIDRVTNLISADEIRLLQKDQSLIVSSNNPIIKGRVSPYYNSPKYRKYASIPPVPFKSEVDEVNVPLLLTDMQNEAKAKNTKPKAA